MSKRLVHISFSVPNRCLMLPKSWSYVAMNHWIYAQNVSFSSAKNLLQSSMADESCWATTTLRCFQWFCLQCLIQHKHTVLVQSKLRFRSLKLNTFFYTQIHPGFVRITNIYIFDAWQISRSKSKKTFQRVTQFYTLARQSVSTSRKESWELFPNSGNRSTWT